MREAIRELCENHEGGHKGNCVRAVRKAIRRTCERTCEMAELGEVYKTSWDCLQKLLGFSAKELGVFYKLYGLTCW